MGLHHHFSLCLWDIWAFLSGVPWSKVAILGMVIPPIIGNPYNRYINFYYKVDDHPPLLHGNNGSLDPSTGNPLILTWWVLRLQKWSRNQAAKSLLLRFSVHEKGADPFPIGSMYGIFTPPKTNMEPKNEGLEDDFPFQRVDFQVPC